MEFLQDHSLLGASLEQHAYFLTFLFGGYLVLRLFFAFWIAKLEVLAKKTKTTFDDLLISYLKSVRLLFFFLLFFLGLIFFYEFQDFWDQTIQASIATIVTFGAILFLFRSIDYATKTLGKKLDKNVHTIFFLFSRIAKLIVSIIAGLFLLSFFGINITSLLAGLGIGGIAIALAVQGVLTDIFSSLSISLDNPFSIGDFIEVDGNAGTVEHIGVKSTRIRSIDGEEVSIPNAILTSSKIHNYTRVKIRRGNIGFGVEYNTDQKKLHAIPKMVQEIVEKTEGCEFVRCRFDAFGASSLDFVLVFTSLAPDYDSLVERKEHLLYAIFDRFAVEGIGMAFPTRTVYLEQST